MQVLSYAGQIMHHVNPDAAQMSRRTDAREEQDLRRVQCACRQDDLAFRPDDY